MEKEKPSSIELDIILDILKTERDKIASKMISRNYMYGSAWGDFYTHIKEYYKWRYSSEGLWQEYKKE